MSYISIALAAYNGIKYINAQLDSILAQTLPADEVIIFDDNSTDGTFEFCEKYIAENNLINWQVFKNEKNLGVAKNFRQAISKCTGEFIFTCDQDDVWLPDKIEVMINAIKTRPEIKLLISNYIPIENGKKIKVKLKNLNRNDGTLIQYKLKNTWLDTLRPGCTYCFRRELAEMFEVFDIENIYHDAMLWQYAIISNSLWLLNRQLIKFIRHGDNNTDPFPKDKPNIAQRLKKIDEDLELYKKFINASEILKMPDENKKLLQKKIKFLENRRRVLEKKNIFRIAFFTLMNFKYYPTFRNAMSDTYAAVFIK